MLALHHDGGPLSDPLEAQPPLELGPVRSAGTNVIDGRVRSLVDGALKHQVPRLVQVGSVLGGSAGFLLGLAAEWALLGRLPPGASIASGMGAGMVLGPVVALWRARSPRTTTFVGELGVARVTPAGVETLLFANATRVEGGVVVEKVLSVFGVATAGGRLDLAWRDARGRCLFRIAGRFDERHAVPRANSLHFARAALAAWEAQRGR